MPVSHILQKPVLIGVGENGVGGDPKVGLSFIEQSPQAMSNLVEEKPDFGFTPQVTSRSQKFVLQSREQIMMVDINGALDRAERILIRECHHDGPKKIKGRFLLFPEPRNKHCCVIPMIKANGLAKEYLGARGEQSKPARPCKSVFSSFQIFFELDWFLCRALIPHPAYFENKQTIEQCVSGYKERGYIIQYNICTLIKMSKKNQPKSFNPLAVIFKFLQSKSRVEIWLFDNNHIRLEGKILGFDEFMNIVLDQTYEIKTKSKVSRPLGKILVKGENVTLLRAVGEVGM